MAANHNDTITISITLDAAPLVAASFGDVLLLVDQATNSLGGARVVTYADLASANVDQLAGLISVSTLAAVQVAFSQRPTPARFKVGRVDTVGLETYAAGLAACIVADPVFYGVCIDVRTDVEILLIAAAIEADTKLFMFQSADSDWLTTGGIPGALAALDSLERSIGIWHDTAAVWADVGWIVNRLAFDPDVISATWNAAPNAITAYATAPTQAQKDFADTNHINLGLEFGSATFYIDAAVNMAGRPIYEILTADWFEARLQEAVITQKINYAARGEKIVVGEPGKALLKSLIDAQFDIGVRASHFVEGEVESTMLTITPADLAAQRIRGSGRAQIAVDGRIFDFSFNFGRVPLADS